VVICCNRGTTLCAPYCNAKCGIILRTSQERSCWSFDTTWSLQLHPNVLHLACTANRQTFVSRGRDAPRNDGDLSAGDPRTSREPGTMTHPPTPPQVQAKLSLHVYCRDNTEYVSNCLHNILSKCVMGGGVIPFGINADEQLSAQVLHLLLRFLDIEFNGITIPWKAVHNVCDRHTPKKMTRIANIQMQCIW
jgi:hypothetical protein